MCMRMQTANTMIPSEIMTEILYLVPAKSIGRFRCVSKGWLSLLTDPLFIKTRQKTHQKALNRNHHFLLKYNYDLWYSHPFHHPGPVILEPSKLPIKLPRLSKFEGSCEGLVLVSHQNMDRFNKLVLFNPTTWESVQLPQCLNYYPPDWKPGYIYNTHGVGYDSVTDDYNVITFICFECVNRHDRTTIPVFLYSLSSNSWRQLIIDSPYDCYCSPPAVYVNGFLHWIGTKRGTNDRVIVAFSLVDECFSEVPSPDLCYNTKVTSNNYCKLIVLGGKLAIYVNPGTYSSLFIRDVEYFEVWLMNEYGVKESWTKIPVDILDKEFCMEESKIFDDNGKIRVVTEGKMLTYDFEERTFSKKVYILRRSFKPFCSYVESLVSPKRNDTTIAEQIHNASSTKKQNVSSSKDGEAVLPELALDYSREEWSDEEGFDLVPLF